METMNTKGRTGQQNREKMINAVTCVSAIYIALALSLSFFSNYVFFAFGTPWIVVSLLVCWRLQQSHVWRIEPWGKVYGIKGRKLSFSMFFIIVFSLSFIYWMAFYPGGFNLDAYGQWLQAHRQIQYDDWHPFLSTLLIQFCTSICDKFEFCILVQIVSFSLAFAWLLKSLEKAGISTWILVVVAIYTGLSPSIGLNTICLTKDVQFTIVLTALSAINIEMIRTEGEWLNSWLHGMITVVFSTLACLIRHNGVLFIIPMLLIGLLSFSCNRKKYILIVFATALLIVVFKGPVMKKMDVLPHDNVVGEAVGVPLGIMGNAIVNHPEKLPEDVYSFLTDIAPQQEWEKEYIPGEWDSCKWSFSDGSLFQNESLRHILSLTFKTVFACPGDAYQSFRLNTRIVWEPFVTDISWIPDWYIAKNNIGIEKRPNVNIQRICNRLISITEAPGLNMVTWNTGCQMILLLLLFAVTGYKTKLRLTIMFVPLVIYNLGTMMLLAGPNQRYFYCTAVLFLPIILSMLIKDHPDTTFIGEK